MDISAMLRVATSIGECSSVLTRDPQPVETVSAGRDDNLPQPVAVPVGRELEVIGGSEPGCKGGR